MIVEKSLEESGILRDNLRVGVVSTVTSDFVKINLLHAGEPSGSYIGSSRYGRGEVGEFILIEGQQSILLGRLTEVKLPERDREELSQGLERQKPVDAIGHVRLLGTIDIESLKVQAGVSSYPRLGDRVFSAPSEFIAALPRLTISGLSDLDAPKISLELGSVAGEENSMVCVTPEKLFGRHCAILGSTGGGKSWTTAKIIEECSKYSGSKIILIDATGEYRSIGGDISNHFHFGSPTNRHESSEEIRIPPTDFVESDFIALFDPAGKVQGPKLREAIRSLRLAMLAPEIFPSGFIVKKNQSRQAYRDAMNFGDNSKLVDSPAQPFNVRLLLKQLIQECCYDNGDSWGAENPNDITYCSSLLTRIQAVIYSPSLVSVFQRDGLLGFGDAISNFLSGGKSIMRVCLSDISYEFYAREMIANVIGRKLLDLAREEAFRNSPLLIVVDEAHNFLGKRVGSDDHSTRLDSFELIAKEGRKYGLNICLSTQRPRDITEGVLSQMGTLLVHRLTNDRDREIVERSCGDIDRSAAAFLPNLKQGEVALVGVDFPIPMTIQMKKPVYPPVSDGPSFQKLWRKKD